MKRRKKKKQNLEIKNVERATANVAAHSVSVINKRPKNIEISIHGLFCRADAIPINLKNEKKIMQFFEYLKPSLTPGWGVA